tara:strand:+ start:76 stop:306 length:231 start_codon:yes stop_codon:yes gene_type:complete
LFINETTRKRKEQMTKKKWDKLPLMTWKFTMYKEDEKGNQKFYEYTGDHSGFTDGIDNEDLNEIDKEVEEKGVKLL